MLSCKDGVCMVYDAEESLKETLRENERSIPLEEEESETGSCFVCVEV